MAFDAIQICFGELNMKVEEHVMKAVQKVDVNVDKDKLLRAIRTSEFVDELIRYIFEYPDDDYMTMECLCRKLYKHGLIGNFDGHWMPLNTADRKTEPQTPYDNCQSCLHWVYDGYWYCECNECHYEPKDEPQTVETMSCQECKHWDNGCTADYFCKYEPKDEPQTETEIARAIVHRIIDDAVIAEDAYPDLRQKMHDAVDEYEPQTDN